MGRALRLLAALPSYLKIAWWGLVAPRFEREPHTLHQAVILDAKGRVLLALRQDLRGWELPGGAAHPGESAEQALCREVHEETGLDVTLEAHVGDYRRTGFRPHVARVQRCQVRGGALRASAETPRLAWVEPTELPRTLLLWCRGPLADALVPRAAPVTRCEHQGWRHVLVALWIDLVVRWRGV